ncbi:hypothetical protein FISHEDRAFT_69941 [Fistulina hepatica ATCC 64428]|uniref:SGNH hydrolase-type esterase domain-containing protein n=1 Tax=Fistulina hepatica ATCC 64428 TaxID=1128425 RepID=A0A0D7AK78_9AGAR|nr:hypothetical protein FISHEDRAFT_69941 [Fistulina hepatica ATCC 64428]
MNSVRLVPSDPRFQLSGRWEKSPAGSITAYWCGASISFIFQGPFLSVVTGTHTERKNEYNGGTPMFVCSVIALSDYLSFRDASQSMTKHDAHGQENIVVYRRANVNDVQPMLIELTMIDWASVLQIDAFMVRSSEDVLDIQDYGPRMDILLIGDTVSCGYSDGSELVPYGCLSAFPFVCKRWLQHGASIRVSLDLVAYPGITLVDMTPEEDGMPGVKSGMATQFFCASIISSICTSPVTHHGHHPSVIIIALGSRDEAEYIQGERFSATMIAFIVRLVNAYASTVRHICILYPFVDFTASDLEADMMRIEHMIPDIVKEAQVALAGRVNVWATDIAESMNYDLTMDGLSPSIRGHEILGHALAQALQPIREQLAYSLPRRSDTLF